MIRFTAGDRVQVLALGKTGHVRIPHYIRQKFGHIVEYCGTYLNPEDLAVGKTSGKAVELYRVEFCHADIWQDAAILQHDRLIIEIYDHWLTKAEDSKNEPRS